MSEFEKLNLTLHKLGRFLMITSIILLVIVPFLFGMILGFILITLLVQYLLKHYPEQTFSIILGISLSSVVTLLIPLFSEFEGIFSIMISFLLLGIGYLFTYKLE